MREADIEADAPGAVGLLSLVNPESVYTVGAFRHVWRASPADARRKAWCVEMDGDIVGWAFAGLMVETSEPGVGWVSVTVHPARREAGLGASLLGAAEHHAAAIGVTRLLSFSRADDATASFARAHGYEQTAANEVLVIDPRRVEQPAVPGDVEIRSFRQLAGNPRPIFDVDLAASLDMPGEVPFDAITYEHWLARFLHSPLLDHDASNLVTVDGLPATYTMLLHDRETHRGQNNGTGTVPEFRGRGLATLAKRASLKRAAQLGCTAVYTGNDATNAPMLAINRKLGYEVCGAELSWSKTLAPTSAL